MNSEIIFKRLKLRYFVAFIALAALSIFAYLNLYYLIRSQYVYAEIINKSGKQRMLSQRIALLAHQYDDTKKNWLVEYKHLFLKAVATFEDDHHFLMRQEINDYLRTIYFGHLLDENVNTFIAKAKAFAFEQNSKKAHELFRISQEILPLLDEAVNEYQRIDEAKKSTLQMIEGVILLSTLLTLLLEALFIFYPSLNELKRGVEKDKIILENSKYAFLNDFFRSIAHQWRQPLTAISLVFDNIQDMFTFNELNETNLDELCKTGKEHIRKLDTTIRNTTDTHQGNTKHAFNITTSIRHAVRVVQSNRRLSGTDIRIETPDFMLNGDINGFMQVMATLLSNSLDAIESRQDQEPSFSGVITIESKGEGNNLCICVTDNGGGITVKQTERIFEPYFTTKFASHNKGMSLYVAKKILEDNFAGTIRATSENGETHMRVEIPLHV